MPTLAQQAVLYVIIAGEGEYSDRTEWVCGAFTNEDEARQLVEQKAAEDRAKRARREEWMRKRYALVAAGDDARMEVIRATNEGRPASPEAAAAIEREEAEYAAFVAQYGEYPEGVLAERYNLVALPLGQWGRWESHRISDDG